MVAPVTSNEANWSASLGRPMASSHSPTSFEEGRSGRFLQAAGWGVVGNGGATSLRVIFAFRYKSTTIVQGYLLILITIATMAFDKIRVSIT
jgi:hypothetical protein